LDKKIFLDIQFLELDKRGFLTYVGGVLGVKSEKNIRSKEEGAAIHKLQE